MKSAYFALVFCVLSVFVFSGCVNIQAKRLNLKEPSVVFVANPHICDDKSRKECNDLGVKFELEDNIKMAKICYQYACDNDLGVACSNLGSLYQKLDEYPNLEALRLFLKACELKSGYGCHNAANLYRLASGVENDFVKAIKLYEKACVELRHGASCTNLGGMHQFSLGVETASRDIARKFYKMGCELKDEIGCKNFSLLTD